MIDNVCWEEQRIAKYFAEQVVKRAEELELPLWAVASYSGVTESTFRNYLKAYNLPKGFTLVRIASALECSVTDLLGY